MYYKEDMASTKQRTYRAKWRSEKSERSYRALDDAQWQELTDSPPEALDLDTRFGPTRVYRWAGTGPPIIFLHGVGDTSIRWIPYAAALGNADVYGVDLMGDVGRSRPDVGFTDASDYGRWLDDTIDGLGLDAPHLVGESLGGYVALTCASQCDRVASVVGLDPVGLVKLRMFRFIRWGFGAGLAYYTPGPIRRWRARRLRQPLLLDPPAMKLYLAGQRGHPMQLPPLPLFTDEQLAAISAPVHVLAAEHSAPFDARKMVERVESAIPKGTAVILPAAGHALSMDRFDDCLAAIRTSAGVGR